jgi:hypothetical protein
MNDFEIIIMLFAIIGTVGMIYVRSNHFQQIKMKEIKKC